MDQRIAQFWKNAMDGLKRAEEYLAAGETELAKTEAQNAAFSGLQAIDLLLHEQDKRTLSIVHDEMVDSNFFGWEKDCSRPADYIAKARKFLKSYSNLSPPESKLPFE